MSASAFNANVGAWNTARVTDLTYVCAAPGPAARTMADALGRASVRRGRLCVAAPPMRARVRARAGTRLRGALDVGTAVREGRFDNCIRIYAYICVRVRARPEPETLNRTSPGRSASTAFGFGAQAFYAASAFNANIGAWNTASVTTLYQVCATPGLAARTMADALGRASVRRGLL